MNKKIKIVGTFSALVISICMLTVGVLAASSVSLSVSSTVSFSASGVYASVSGSIWRGANESSLAQVTENANQTLAETKNFVEGQISDGTFTGLENGWNPSEVEFSETNKIVEYRLTFKNYSEFPIAVEVTNNSVAGTNITMQEITSALESIPADNGVTSATYTLRLTLNNVSVSTNMDIDLSINLVSTQSLSYDIVIANYFDSTFLVDINGDRESFVSDTVTVKAGDYVEISSSGHDLSGVYVMNSSGGIAETIIEFSEGDTTGVIWHNFPKLEQGNYISLEWYARQAAVGTSPYQIN